MALRPPPPSPLRVPDYPYAIGCAAPGGGGAGFEPCRLAARGALGTPSANPTSMYRQQIIGSTYRQRQTPESNAPL